MIWRAAKKVKISGGITIRVPMAMMRPHSTPVSVMKPAAPTGSVREFRPVSSRARMNSFQGDPEGEDPRDRVARLHHGKEDLEKDL